MNAVVQCLSNTDLLAEYLGLERYKADIRRGGTSGDARGDEAQSSGGEVTEQLATLVRGLWTLEYTPQLSVEFKVRTASLSGSCNVVSEALPHWTELELHRSGNLKKKSILSCFFLSLSFLQR